MVQERTVSKIRGVVDPSKLDIVNPDNICGVITKNGSPCRRHAGWGTDHYGRGACKFHEGKATEEERIRSLNKREYIVGMVEPGMRDRLRVLMDDPDILNCRAELAVLKLKFEELLVDGERVVDKEGNVEFVKARLDTIAVMAGIIIKNAKIIHEMEVGKRHYIHVSIAGAIVEAFADVGRRYVKDPAAQKQFETDVITVLRSALSDGRSTEVAANLIGPTIIDDGRRFSHEEDEW